MLMILPERPTLKLLPSFVIMSAILTRCGSTDSELEDPIQYGWTVYEPNVGQDLRAVWGSSASDVWAVGDAGTMLHYDSKKWNTLPTAIDMHLWSIWGSGPDNIVATGADIILHYGPE